MKKLIGFSLAVLLGLTLVGCGDSGSSSDNSSSAAESSSSSSQKASGFDSEEISDDAINSVETYEDFLNMYQKILDVFFIEFEAAYKDAGLDTDDTFTAMKDQYNQQFEQQKEQYGSLGDQALPEKETYTNTLITFRDTVEEAVNGVKEAH